MSEPRWLPVEEVLRLHSMQLAAFGGKAGVRDRGLLEAAVVRPRQRYFYGEIRSVAEVGAAYCIALNANHPFLDGNKRVSFHAMLVFLRLHGLRLTASHERATETMMDVAAGRAGEDELRTWVTENIRKSPL